MNPHESTAANADIWARYLEERWGRWLAPMGASEPLAEIVEGAAANVASILTLVAAAPIAWLFSANASEVEGELAPARVRVDERGMAA